MITPLPFIDTHCHLDFVEMGDTDNVINTSVAVGVARFIVPAVSANNWLTVLDLSFKYPQIYCALGIHPHFLSTNHQLDKLRALATQYRHQIIAIGEIGLDGAIDCPIEEQLPVLIEQLKLAKSLSLPVICHAHKAYDVLLKQLRQIKLPRGGVIHGFSGSLVQAQEFIKLGFYIGVGGVITYDRANKIRRTVSQLPLERLILETDSPDMPLQGFQGQINHPNRVPLVAQQLSELTGHSLEKVAAVTCKNSHRLFEI